MTAEAALGRITTKHKEAQNVTVAQDYGVHGVQNKQAGGKLRMPTSEF